ncbi:MAG: preprotein translocase subunit SecA [Verrucomicrobiales bacterium]|nr:preprotein translocase subunit SecA [Verrucomicrobiales bacterium]
MWKFFKKIFGSSNERMIKKIWPMVEEINRIEADLQNGPESALTQKTIEWKEELSKIEDLEALKARLEAILPEAYAVVKNACRRQMNTTVNVRGHDLKWEMIPFDVQLIGGVGLHRGYISEMATGEGKTLVATLPVYLNALTGRGVHVVTVNDYLAQRDSEWMGHIYKFLGLTVGCIVHDQNSEVRREQYNCDITYGTNSEFGFDYLRDNGMANTKEEQVQRGHYYAIVDEVDSILIDEARTPLIISGPAVMARDNEVYIRFKPQIEGLVRRQKELCSRFVREAKDGLAKLHDAENPPADADELRIQIGLSLYRAKLGQPRSADLAAVLEEPSNIKLMNKAEMSLHLDQTKKDLYAQKEELFFAMEEKSHDADLTEKGRGFLSPKDPEAFMLPDIITQFSEIDNNGELDTAKRNEAKQEVQKEYEAKAEKIHVIAQLLKAYCLYEIDQQYIVQENKVIIVDENTGRPMEGRRWSDGLHQAVEAKEGVRIEDETQTYATITIQNYFRLYSKLGGMTGTAETEANEFLDIYKLGVMVIPTNKECLREDYHDTVYKTKREKFEAVLREIQQVHAKGRPILVGTASVDTSELVSRILKRNGLIHSVLNAKFHEQEAEIVTRAGQKGSITIATNMAGRGTDIKLGEGVADSGGLHVIGTERHESRRIDRQLRGRCARQGDPGSSHFFIALEDDLMRLFGSDKIVKVMERVGLEEGQELEHPLLNRSIQTAQKRVEQQNFQIRKRTLEYDDVMNKQRAILYGFRNEVLEGIDVRDRIMDIMEEVVTSKVDEFSNPETELEDWDARGLSDWVNLTFPLGMPESEIRSAAESGTEAPAEGSLFEGMSPAQFAVCIFISEAVRRAYDSKISYEDEEALEHVERYIVLNAIDSLWREHLYNMDSLRTAIHLRQYGQRDPLIEFKKEAYDVFEEMMVNVKTEICHNIFRSASSLSALESFMQNLPSVTRHDDMNAFGGGAMPQQGRQRASDVVSEAAEEMEKIMPVRTGPKVGRNDKCPCNSGKKYKHCCGR